MATICIGTSGFSYQHWIGVLYPHGLSPRRWLEYYMETFDTVELNVTFYRLPGDATVASWARRAREGFVYAVKLSQYLTHSKRLLDPAEPLARYLARMRGLGPHLGPVLVQLPPGMVQDLPRLDAFLALCDPALRWVVEFRHPSWLTEDTYAVLRAHGAALCIHDLLPDHPRVVTAPFTYLRFHGSGTLYGGSYPDAALAAWARQLQAWQRDGLDCYAYFNNDAHGYAVQNARTLMQMVA